MAMAMVVPFTVVGLVVTTTMAVAMVVAFMIVLGAVTGNWADCIVLGVCVVVNMAVAEVVAKTRDWVMTMVVGIVGAMVVGITGVVTGRSFGIVPVGVAVALGVAIGVAAYKLEKSFSKFHTFLILTGTSNVGLGLGWMVYRLFKPV